MKPQPTPDLESKVITCGACGGDYPRVVKCKLCDQRGRRRIPKMTGREIDRMNRLMDITSGLTAEQRRTLINLTSRYEQHVPPPKHIGRH